MGDPVAWFDVGAADEAPLKPFYAELFGWRLQPASERYTFLATGGGIPGGIGRSRSGDAWLTFYVAVADLQASLDKAVALGSSVVVGVTDVAGALRFAMFNDPDGLLIGMIQLGAGVAPAEGAGSPVDYFEIMGSDARRSRTFYGELFGWNFDAAMPTYAFADTGGGGISGAVGGADEANRWATIYARVDDLERCLARAEELGGTRLYGPVVVSERTTTGAIRDPAGNVMGVYRLIA